MNQTQVSEIQIIPTPLLLLVMGAGGWLLTQFWLKDIPAEQAVSYSTNISLIAALIGWTCIPTWFSASFGNGTRACITWALVPLPLLWFPLLFTTTGGEMSAVFMSACILSTLLLAGIMARAIYTGTSNATLRNSLLSLWQWLPPILALPLFGHTKSFMF
ncbi:MAG: hypothetical protein AAF529_04830 [Pseudomonadota bacterium]